MISNHSETKKQYIGAFVRSAPGDTRLIQFAEKMLLSWRCFYLQIQRHYKCVKIHVTGNKHLYYRNINGCKAMTLHAKHSNAKWDERREFMLRAMTPVPLANNYENDNQAYCQTKHLCTFQLQILKTIVWSHVFNYKCDNRLGFQYTHWWRITTVI